MLSSNVHTSSVHTQSPALELKQRAITASLHTLIIHFASGSEESLPHNTHFTVTFSVISYVPVHVSSLAVDKS